MRTIVYELNEVPTRLFDFYAEAFPNSAFAKLRESSQLFQTTTADVGSLSPWITWPTMHRGVSNVDHEISDLGQDLTKINYDFPNVYELLTARGVKVGVFGSLHSYPLPKSLDNYSFYVPDTFAADESCFPESLNAFQAFNLSMVKSSGRNVSRRLNIKDAASFLVNARKLGLKSSTFYRLTRQIVSERINNDRVVRRRTSQVEIAFDLYLKLLIDSKPDISFFFTNHVASSMHRYWPTIFPNDYPEGKFEQDWRTRWQEEIPHSVKIANFQLAQLLSFCESTGTELIVCSSMGQAAVQDVLPIDRQVLITRIKSLMNFLGAQESDWEPRLAMAPIVMIHPKNQDVFEKIKRLQNIRINDTVINYFVTSTGDIRFDINLTNIDRLQVHEAGREISPRDLGIELVELQDASGSYAYHIPKGILIRYNPAKIQRPRKANQWGDLSALDFAPSLLKKFNCQIPAYMNGDSTVFNQA